MELEDKIRRRLAPFLVEGKIAPPRIEAVEASRGLRIRVQLKQASAEAALRDAMSDLSDAHLVITQA